MNKRMKSIWTRNKSTFSWWMSLVGLRLSDKINTLLLKASKVKNQLDPRLSKTHFLKQTVYKNNSNSRLQITITLETCLASLWATAKRINSKHSSSKCNSWAKIWWIKMVRSLYLSPKWWWCKIWASEWCQVCSHQIFNHHRQQPLQRPKKSTINQIKLVNLLPLWVTWIWCLQHLQLLNYLSLMECKEQEGQVGQPRLQGGPILSNPSRWSPMTTYLARSRKPQTINLMILIWKRMKKWNSS